MPKKKKKKGSGWKSSSQEKLDKDYETRGRSSLGGGGAQYLEDDVEIYEWKLGKKDTNNLRFVPIPEDLDYDTFGYHIFVHNNIGPNFATVICPKAMGVGECPVCELQSEMWEFNSTAAKKMYPQERVLINAIDRDNEDKGIQLVNAPKLGLYDEILSAAWDKNQGGVLDIADAEDGYDVSFKTRKSGTFIKYKNIAVDREASELGDVDPDEFIDFEDALIVLDYDEIEELMGNEDFFVDKVEEDEDDDEDEDEKPRKKKKKKKKRTEPEEDDEEEEEEEENDEEEEEEKPRKKKKKKKIAKKKRIKKPEPEEDEDEDEDEEEEEEEEKPRKKKKKKKKRIKKRKEEEEEDDEEEEEDEDEDEDEDEEERPKKKDPVSAKRKKLESKLNKLKKKKKKK